MLKSDNLLANDGWVPKSYLQEIADYQPKDEKEKQDKKVMLDYLKRYPQNVLSRENEIAHLTVAAFILNKEQTRVLMAYHLIFQSFAWLGGHADGNVNLLEVALKEAREETGLTNPIPLSNQIAALDILPVWSHVKNGKPINSHLHLNVSYLLVADEKEPLTIKSDENSAVAWIPIAQLKEYCSEPDMMPVYKKLIQAAHHFQGN